MIVPAIGCISLTFVTNEWIPVMIILCVLLGMRGGVYAGRYRVPYEVTPDYPGPTYGFVNTIGQCAGFVTPLITSAFTSYDETDPAGWNNLFYLATGLLVASHILFLIFARFDPVQLSDHSNEDNSSS